MYKTSKSSGGMKLLWVFGFIGLVIVKGVQGFDNTNVTEIQYASGRGFYNRPLLVGLTLINGAAAKGAGIPPAPSSCFLCIHFSFQMEFV